jgi:superfamily II DNA or RNA helicase
VLGRTDKEEAQSQSASENFESHDLPLEHSDFYPAGGSINDCQLHNVLLRPMQSSALEIIIRARKKSIDESRVTTAAIVAPTGSGKDLLPLALARCCKGTSVVFVPYVFASSNTFVHHIILHLIRASGIC